MNKVYTRINWENEPSVETPLNATNLNNMDLAIDTLDDRVISQDTVKADKTQLSNLVSNWTMDEETGVITITKYNGEQVIFDLNIEKIPVKFVLSSNGILTMTTDDGTEFTADIGSMIPIYTFKDSDTVGFKLTGSADNKVFTFFVKDYSIGESQMDPSYLSNINSQVLSAESYANQSSNKAVLSESYAIGGTGTRDGEDSDNSKYYSEVAKSHSDNALQYSQAASDTFNEVKEKLGIAEFNVDDNGNLVYTDNTAYNFTVDDDGYLNWEVA